MSHAAVAARLDQLRPAIAWLAAHRPGVPYVLSEVGNSLNPTHDYAYQAVLGSALWQVDLQLYGLSAGVARFHFQQIMHSGFDLWLPQASGDAAEAQVFASFYAQPFVADFVGRGGTTQVAAVPVVVSDDDDEDSNNIAGYVAFEEGGAPRRLAIVNLDYWNSSSSPAPRAAATVALRGLPADVTSVTVDRLSSPLGAGAGADTITYAGSQWTYASNGVEVPGVRDDSETLAVGADGRVDVSVDQSSAVLVRFVS